MLKEQERARFETNKLQRIITLFMLNPTVQNSMTLAEVLSAAQFADPLSPLFGQLSFIEGRFFLVYLVARLFVARSPDTEKLSFRSKLSQALPSMNPQSRGHAFQQVLDDPDRGFLLALADTDDPSP
jgi:hypothetical protein